MTTHLSKLRNAAGPILSPDCGDAKPWQISYGCRGSLGRPVDDWPLYASTETSLPKIEFADTHPLIRPRLLPIWNRAP